MTDFHFWSVKIPIKNICRSLNLEYRISLLKFFYIYFFLRKKLREV